MTCRTPAPLILASGSPRRRALLTEAGVRFEVRPAEIAERAVPGEKPEALAARLACEKAITVARRVGHPPRRWILGADTVVALGDRVLGKPGTAERALATLRALAGRPHRVLTGIALVDSRDFRAHSRVTRSDVFMRAADLDELRRYAASDEPLDKAGGYALQGRGRGLVDRVVGSETNVIGLPVEETLALLRLCGADGLAS